VLFDRGAGNSEQDPPLHSGALEHVSPEIIRSQLEKLLASRTLAPSQQLCRLLRFVVDQETSGQGDQLKEYLLGVEVFRKDESFDPRIDPVVRTEARRLRNKLTDYYAEEGRNDPVVIDLPKGSYRPVFRAGPAGTAIAPATSAALTRNRRTLLAAFFVVALGAGAIYWWTRRSAPPVMPSIAVLPLENLSADPEQEYFSDGLTDELIRDLAKLRGLRVISRTSVLPYKRLRKPLAEIARQLGVDYVVEGTILRSGDRVRISAQLIAVPHEHHLWAEAFERDHSDALALQAEVARSIARQIDIHVTPEEELRLGRRPIDAGAQDNYLKGRFSWHTRRQDLLLKSVDYFQQAIAKEPGYALAYAGLSDSYSVLSGRATGPERKELLDLAKQAAKKAIELDDRLGEAHAALAVSSWDWTWQENEREFRRAIDLSPGYAPAHQWYSRILLQTGRIQEGLAEAFRAMELDPLSPAVSQMFGAALYTARQYDRAIEQLRHTVEAFPDFEPGYASLGMAYEAKGMHSQAADVLERAVRLTGGAPTLTALLAHTRAGAGDTSDARRLLQEFRQRQGITPVVWALLYMDSGDLDHAFEWFETGVREHSMFIDELKAEPMYDRLHSDPRFTALLRKMNLAN
jgi:TolB-like protein/Tfp pilus assembly protein PilF